MGMIGNGIIGGSWSGGPVANPILLPDGSGDTPSLTFASSPALGIHKINVNNLGFGFGSAHVGLGQSGVVVQNMTLPIGWGTLGFSFDTLLYRDGAPDTLALKNGNAEQQFNIYSGNGAYGLIKSKQELVTTTAAATATTAADFIPDGAIPLAISTYVQTAITIANLTGYNIGDGTDADRWGAITGHVVGTKSNNSDWTATTIQAFIAAQAITLTAVGANFPAGGKIRICMTYMLSSEPTS